MNIADKPNVADGTERLSVIVDMMRDLSRHTDPQEMVRAYREKIRQILPITRTLSLSRRGLSFPEYRITRSTTWAEEINPWKEKHLLPLLRGVLLARLIYSDNPEVIDLEIAPGEPAAEYLEGHLSLLAIPMFDMGESLNMVVLLQKERHASRRKEIPELVCGSTLFARATANL